MCRVKGFLHDAQELNDRRLTLYEGSALSERDLVRTRAESASAVLLLADRFSPSVHHEDLSIQFQVGRPFCIASPCACWLRPIDFCLEGYLRLSSSGLTCQGSMQPGLSRHYPHLLGLCSRGVQRRRGHWSHMERARCCKVL